MIKKMEFGLIDPTTMSRIFWWVQDEKEQEFVIKQGIERVKKVPPTPTQAYKTKKEEYITIKKVKKSKSKRLCLGDSVGVGGDNNIIFKMIKKQ